MNRRVFMTVTDGQGRTILDRAGVSEVNRRRSKFMADQRKCCDDILKRRLDKLDRDRRHAAEDGGRERCAARKGPRQPAQAHDALDQYVKALPKPLTEQQTTSRSSTRAPPSRLSGRACRVSRSSCLNAGADQSGNITFTGRGRYFMPFKEQFAVQLQGEYMYFRDRQEGQSDFGLVNRFATRAQAGFFGSLKHVNFSGHSAGTNIFTDRPVYVEQSAIHHGPDRRQRPAWTGFVHLDYLFSGGKFGIFGSKGFLQDDVLNRIATANATCSREAYLRTIDQVGVSTTFGIGRQRLSRRQHRLSEEPGNADRLGGTARFVFPLRDRFAFTLEGGMNETLLSRDNTGRVVAGFQFGNFMRPKDYLEGYNGVQHAVPADVPRVRYEVLTRTVRTGNDAPVANAGPDQIGVAAGHDHARRQRLVRS